MSVIHRTLYGQNRDEYKEAKLYVNNDALEMTKENTKNIMYDEEVVQNKRPDKPREKPRASLGEIRKLTAGFDPVMREPLLP